MENDRMNNYDYNATLKEVNNEIKEGLEFWANVVLQADSHNWAYNLNYDAQDILNVSYILTHVVGNVGIKSGHIKRDNCKSFGARLRMLILEMTGYDTKLISKKNNNDLL